jgi:HD-like signal output (HDOD) protein
MSASQLNKADSCTTAPPDRFVKLFDRITEISSIPHVGMRIIELVNDSETDLGDVVELVRYDPALAMRLMRTVNSSYYGLRTKIVDLEQAAALLGFEEIRNLVLTVYVAPLFRETFEYGDYTRRRLWTHMIAAGMLAQRIVETCKDVSRQEAYLAGLLHDIGLILIDQYLHPRFCQILQTLSDDTPVHHVEAMILGFDHATLGAYIATRWNLPEPLAVAIKYHHSPEQYDGPFRQLVDAITLADYLCYRKGLSPLGVGKEQTLPQTLFKELGLTREKAVTIVDQLDDVLVLADTFAGAQLSCSF